MDNRFYPTRKHDTCVETRIRHNDTVKPYYFCGDDCLMTVEQVKSAATAMLAQYRGETAMTFPFHYKGAVTLSNGEHHVDLHNVELWEERDVLAVLDADVLAGATSWHGVARALGVPYRLLDLLGGEVEVRLPDGRLGHAHVTGYCDESVWIVEITGIGHVPNLNTI